MLTRMLTEVATGTHSTGVARDPGAHKITTDHIAVMSPLSAK